MVMDAEDLINDEDLDMDITSGGAKGGKGGAGSAAAPKQQAAELLLNMEGLSARERNRLKRKAKAMGRSESLQAPGTSGRSAKSGAAGGKGGAKGSAAGANSESAGGGGQQRSGSEGVGLAPSTAETAENDESEWAAILAGGWPFQRVCDQLSVDVLDPSWEVRHGAAVGLREVLRSHAGSACVDAPMADEGTSGWAMPGGSGEAWGVGVVNTPCVIGGMSFTWTAG
jgi:TATA-binding protein-associated factor